MFFEVFMGDREFSYFSSFMNGDRCLLDSPGSRDDALAALGGFGLVRDGRLSERGLEFAQVLHSAEVELSILTLSPSRRAVLRFAYLESSCCVEFSDMQSGWKVGLLPLEEGLQQIAALLSRPGVGVGVGGSEFIRVKETLFNAFASLDVSVVVDAASEFIKKIDCSAFEKGDWRIDLCVVHGRVRRESDMHVFLSVGRKFYRLQGGEGDVMYFESALSFDAWAIVTSALSSVNTCEMTV